MKRLVECLRCPTVSEAEDLIVPDGAIVADCGVCGCKIYLPPPAMLPPTCRSDYERINVCPACDDGLPVTSRTGAASKPVVFGVGLQDAN